MRLRGLWDVAALPRAYIAKVAEQKGVLFGLQAEGIVVKNKRAGCALFHLGYM